jgi:ABC-type polysaccharide/polyol phosphate transport system ATPase subunit
MAVVTLENVSKAYSRHGQRQFFHNFLTNWGRTFRAGKPRFYALKNISFRLEQGQSLGVVGPNGAGKSTLLSLVGGLSWPDEGKIVVEGKVVALLELGSGFHPDLTGAENLRLSAALLGFSRKRTLEYFDRIVKFSGVGDFIDEPLRTFSSGMIVRLAFSVAIHADLDILLIDEVLAVGDQSFQAQCIERVLEIKRSGKILICVSHAPQLLKELCHRTLWLDSGRPVREGPTQEILEAYQSSSAVSAGS